MQNNWNYNDLVKNALGNGLLPLQTDVIAAVVKYKDIQVNAPTGSGKTIAFCLGLLEAKKVYEWNKALIIAPTRELVIQIGEVFASLKTGLNYTVCYGGHAFKTEVNNFMGNPDVIIGTPGRICDHIRRESFDFSRVEAFVVDEEDKVKELGFSNELNFILSEIKDLKSSIHVSATAIRDKGLFRVDYTAKDDVSNRFSYFKIEVEEESHKAEALLHLLVSVEPGPTLVFLNHREAVDRIADYCIHNGFKAAVYHGGLEQVERERNLIKFRNGSAQLLFVTDLASRGIDVPNVKRIIHYQFPKDEASFIHRNGRTARMGAEGDVFIIEDQTDANQIDYLSELKVDAFQTEPNDNYWYSPWETIYISLGKKDKVNKVDVLGFLTKELGVKGSQIGKIDTLDKQTFVAVESEIAEKVIRLAQHQKIKKQKFKVDWCR